MELRLRFDPSILPVPGDFRARIERGEFIIPDALRPMVESFRTKNTPAKFLMALEKSPGAWCKNLGWTPDQWNMAAKAVRAMLLQEYHMRLRQTDPHNERDFGDVFQQGIELFHLSDRGISNEFDVTEEFVQLCRQGRTTLRPNKRLGIHQWLIKRVAEELKTISL